jgi:hypothetical protein
MNPVRFVTRRIDHVWEALVMPFRALFVIGLTGLINAMTYNGTWWFKWVALGMGIAVVVSLARGLKSLLVLALAGWIGWKIYQRYGEAARQRFEHWFETSKPKAADLMQALRRAA